MQRITFGLIKGILFNKRYQASFIHAFQNKTIGLNFITKKIYSFFKQNLSFIIIPKNFTLSIRNSNVTVI